MTPGIALLLKGSSADLSATLHAIELAKRTTGIVHAVFVEKKEEAGRVAAKARESGRRTEQFMALARWLGDAERVIVHIHKLESLADDLLVRFCCANRIFCLVLGAGDRAATERKAAWFERFRRRISGEQDWFLPAPWSVIIEPWEEPVFEQVINRLKKGAWSTAAISSLAGSLRPGLPQFNRNETN